MHLVALKPLLQRLTEFSNMGRSNLTHVAITTGFPLLLVLHTKNL
jgi:hypothetical protein